MLYHMCASFLLSVYFYIPVVIPYITFRFSVLSSVDSLFLSLFLVVWMLISELMSMNKIKFK